MKNNIVIVLVLVALAVGGIWYVSSSGAASKDSMVPEATITPDASSPSAMMESGVKEVVMEGTEFKFVADTLTVKKGEKVRLTFKNTGEMKHDWVVDELDVRTQIIEGGKEEVIEFTPDKVGVFEYYCSVGEHRKNGMFGKITVVE